MAFHLEEFILEKTRFPQDPPLVHDNESWRWGYSQAIPTERVFKTGFNLLGFNFFFFLKQMYLQIRHVDCCFKVFLAFFIFMGE